MHRQHSGQRDAALFTAGEPHHIPVGKVRRAELFQRLRNPDFHLIRRQLQIDWAENDVLPDGLRKKLVIGMRIFST